MDILDTLISESGFVGLNWPHLVMMVVGGGLVLLSISRRHQPLLLVPLGFGIFLANLPAGMMGAITGDPTGSHGVGLVQLIYNGLLKSEVLPPMLFLGLGARTDLSPLLQRPMTLLIGAATQFGIAVGATLARNAFGLPLASSLAVGVSGPGDGVTAIYLTTILAPGLLGAVALTLLLGHALLPTLAPLSLRFLTREADRALPLPPPPATSRRARLLFPLVLAMLTMMLAPAAAPLVGMLMLGCLLREAGGAQGLAGGIGGPFADIATVFLGISVGATMTGRSLMQVATVQVMITGLAGMCVSIITGVLLARAFNLVLPADRKINPCLGVAATGGPPTAARVAADYVAAASGGTVDIRQAAEGVNLAGLMGAATAAGLFLGFLR